jgi:hypothetical protein
LVIKIDLSSILYTNSTIERASENQNIFINSEFSKFAATTTTGSGGHTDGNRPDRNTGTR